MKEKVSLYDSFRFRAMEFLTKPTKTLEEHLPTAQEYVEMLEKAFKEEMVVIIEKIGAKVMSGINTESSMFTVTHKFQQLPNMKNRIISDLETIFQLRGFTPTISVDNCRDSEIIINWCFTYPKLLK